MFQVPPSAGASTRWSLVALWILLIYATVPFARSIQRWSDAHWGIGSLRWLALAVIALAVCVPLAELVRKWRRLPVVRVGIVIGICALFAWAAFHLTQTPAEAVHFVEYGMLGLLVFSALARRRRDPLIYVHAVLICALVSSCDEFLQWLTPGRYWDLRDLGQNTMAAALSQLGIAAGFRPPFLERRIAPQSIRVAAALIIAQALLLGCCASNTPHAAAQLAQRFPRLAFLLDNDHAMFEYGWLHEDSDIGRFYSRFDRSELQRLDRQRGAELGPILARYVQHGGFTNFLRTYTPARDAFAHEAMVRLNRRNQYAGVLPKYRSDPAGYRYHVTVAFRENQILERYFSNTLAAAGQRWTEELTAAFQPHVMEDLRYTSEVSRHLIHGLSERSIWLLVWIVVALAAFVAARWGRAPDRPRSPLLDDWGPVVLWTLGIYAAIPYARTIQEWVTDHASRSAFLWIVLAAIGLGFVATIAALRARYRAITKRQLATLGVLAALFSLGTWHLRANAEEAMHLIQYGVLSLLLYRAFSHRYADGGAYGAAFLLGALLGMIDEIIQWITPRRFFDLRDIGINVGAVLLMQLGLIAGLAPRPVRSIRPRSARAVWRLLALNLLVLLACVSNSPELWRPLYSYRPDAFVYDEAMVEYGHRHRDPDLGTFYSRLTLDDLRDFDELRAEEVASIMHRRGADEVYAEFLRRYSPYTDPFVHEFRVRLYRRDRYWEKARISRRDPEKHRELITAAVAEQRILETYFGHCLNAAGRNWPTGLYARARAAARPPPYDSPVSRELITRWTRAQAQGVVGSLLLVVVLAGAYDVHRRKRREAETLAA